MPRLKKTEELASWLKKTKLFSCEIKDPIYSFQIIVIANNHLEAIEKVNEKYGHFKDATFIILQEFNSII
jgi:hypothetical protein